jgi:hypothetical protein
MAFSVLAGVDPVENPWEARRSKGAQTPRRAEVFIGIFIRSLSFNGRFSRFLMATLWSKLCQVALTWVITFYDLSSV